MRRPKSRAKSRADRRALALASVRALKPTEDRYVTALRGIMKAIAKRVVEAIEPLLPTIAARADSKREDASQFWTAIDTTMAQVRAATPGAVKPAFDKMSSGVVHASDRVLGVQLRDMVPAVGNVTNAGNGGLAADIDRARDRNIRLVEDAGRAYAESVRKIVGDPANFGLRVEEIKAKLLARGDVAASRAELIARDQTLKLNSQIAQSRMTRAGIGSYTWSTSGDERVRPEHAALEGKTFTWDGPPDVGHPGEDFQCRCVAIPVVDEAAGLFDTPETVAAPPPVPEPVVAPMRAPAPDPVLVVPAVPFVGGEALDPVAPAAPAKIAVPKRTEKQREKVVEENIAAGMTPKVAERIDKIFGPKSPKLAELQAGYTAKGLNSSLEVNAFGGRVQLSGEIRDAKTGARVTVAYDREITKNADGTLSVYHEHFNVVPEYRSGGTGKALLSNSVRLHHELGVRAISTTPAGSNGEQPYEKWKANQDRVREITGSFKSGMIDEPAMRKQLLDEYKRYTGLGGSRYVGPHAWANLGFQWSEREGERIGKGFATYLRTEHGIPHEEAKATADRLKNSPRELIAMKLEDGKEAGSHFMAEFVGDAEEKWRIKSTKSDEGWQHMKRRLGLEDLKDD